MRSRKKGWLITAAVLTLVGCIIMIGAMTMLNWNFSKLATSKYETNRHVPDGSVRSISVHTDVSDIRFLPAEDGKCAVECIEQSKQRHTVELADGTLTVKRHDMRKWYEYIGISVGSPKITVYLPAGEYGTLTVRGSTGNVEISPDFTFEGMDISQSTGAIKNHASVMGLMKLKTTTGSITLEDVTAGAVELSVTTGRVSASRVSCTGDVQIGVSTGKTMLSDVTCRNFTSNGSTGSITLCRVIASARLAVERSTGDVDFDASDAAEIFVKTDTGDVEGSLRSEKVFVARTDTGKICVPNSTTGGRCEITTDTGDIRITVG